MLGITHERRDWPRAEAAFRRAAQAAAKNDVLFYNLGLIYRRNGLARRSLRAFERSHQINPRHIASNKPARAADRLEEARQEVARLAQIESGFPGGAPDTVDDHRRMAAYLESQGEPLAARGHRLRALEREGPP